MKYSRVLLGVGAMGILAFMASRLMGSDKPLQVSGSIYDFRISTLSGETIDFSAYKGKKILIVNTASKCGFTPQYKELQQLHETYGNQVAILGFPANNFLWQEPGNNDEIAVFCERNYGVTFQMFEKVSVKGKDQHPLFQWLTSKTGKSPSWNFCKYLVDESGKVVGFYPPKVTPLDPEIVSKITSK